MELNQVNMRDRKWAVQREVWLYRVRYAREAVRVTSWHCAIVHSKAHCGHCLSDYPESSTPHPDPSLQYRLWGRDGLSRFLIGGLALELLFCHCCPFTVR